jgi:hypothetical protein
MGKVSGWSFLKGCFWRALRYATGDAPFYRSNRFVADLQSAQSVNGREITFVKDAGRLKWAALICPCGCAETIAVNLMRSHDPSWRVQFERDNSVSFQPSLWVSEDRCGSHFIIRRGCVEWCSWDRSVQS